MTTRHLPPLAEIKKAPMGRAAIEELVTAGVDQNKLESAVQFVLFAQVMPALRIQDVRGFSPKSLALFPEELRRTATRIEMIRRDPLYGMAENLVLPGPHWEETCKNLRVYARFLDVLIRAFRQSAKDNPRDYDLKLFSKRRLMAEVANATGRPPFNRVAELLTAAYDVMGLPLTEEASALRHLWEKHIKKSAQRRFRRMALMMDF